MPAKIHALHRIIEPPDPLTVGVKHSGLYQLLTHLSGEWRRMIHLIITLFSAISTVVNALFLLTVITSCTDIFSCSSVVSLHITLMHEHHKYVSLTTISKPIYHSLSYRSKWFLLFFPKDSPLQYFLTDASGHQCRTIPKSVGPLVLAIVIRNHGQLDLYSICIPQRIREYNCLDVSVFFPTRIHSGFSIITYLCAYRQAFRNIRLCKYPINNYAV